MWVQSVPFDRAADDAAGMTGDHCHPPTGSGGPSVVTIRLTDGRGNTATDSCTTGVYIYD